MLPLTLQGGVTTGGGGQVVIDTQTIFDPESGFTLQTFEVAGGTVTLGTTMDFSNTLFQVDANSSLNVADDAAVKVGSLSGPGTVDLEGTTAANDDTSLTPTRRSASPTSSPARSTASAYSPWRDNGTLTVGGINFGRRRRGRRAAGHARRGWADRRRDVAGQRTGDLRRAGLVALRRPAAFQASSTFDLTLDGTEAGTQYTQLVSDDSTTGINLGNSTPDGHRRL